MQARHCATGPAGPSPVSPAGPRAVFRAGVNATGKERAGRGTAADPAQAATRSRLRELHLPGRGPGTAVATFARRAARPPVPKTAGRRHQPQGKVDGFAFVQVEDAAELTLLAQEARTAHERSSPYQHSPHSYAPLVNGDRLLGDLSAAGPPASSHSQAERIPVRGRCQYGPADQCEGSRPVEL